MQLSFDDIDKRSSIAYCGDILMRPTDVPILTCDEAIMHDVQAQHASQSLSRVAKGGSMCVAGLCNTGSQRGSIRSCRALPPVRLTWIPTTALLAGRPRHKFM